jgi:enoyl-CoA hydratase/carnithine racemase
MNEFLKYETFDNIVLLTMNEPRTRNVLGSASQYDAFEQACRRIQRDREIRAVVLTGAGPAFCGGGDIKDMQSRSRDKALEAVQDRYGYRDGIHRIGRALYDLEVPTIAAVNGPAIGAGLDLACMCDLRIASERAIFAESFVRLGIIPGDGGAWLLQRIVGLSKAAEMTFTGEPIDASEALACGLVTKVVTAGELMPEAMALAHRIAVNPGHALRMAKRLIREAQTNRLDTILEMSAAFQALAHATQDHRVRIDAAVQRLQQKKGKAG